MGDVVQMDKFTRLPERYQRRAREISARVSDIDALCAVSTSEAIGAELKRMRRQLRPQPDTEPAEMAKGFLEACRDLPEWAISEAVNDFLAGRVDNHTGQFMPTCAEFAKRARLIVLPFLSERAALRTEASKIIERAADDARRDQIAIERASPNVRLRVQALTEIITKGTAKKQAITHQDIDPERQRRLDALKKVRPFVSKISETKIGRQP